MNSNGALCLESPQGILTNKEKIKTAKSRMVQ
jgi:hypothetical protein